MQYIYIYQASIRYAAAHLLEYQLLIGLHGRSQDSMQPNSSLGLQGLGERIAEVAKLRTSSQRGAAHLKKPVP